MSSSIQVSSWTLYLVVCLGNILPLVLTMQLSSVDSRLCVDLCQCTSKTVDCNHQDGLSFIPSQIRPDYYQLHISHANLRDRGLSRENFTTIIHLVSLKIVYSKLETIADDSFILMDRLRYVDLSHNNFSKIGSRAFNGLRLTNLYLERNQAGLRIASNMFTGLKVTNLYLQSNGIDKISMVTFKNMKLAKLFLFNNSITAVDRKFEDLFSSSDNLLDLTKNPLDCSCGVSWLPDLINQWRDVPGFVQITCQSPGYLLGRHISNLSKEEFSCETPSISKISVDVSDNYIHLSCHAKGSNAPKISWTQINANSGGETSHYEEVITTHHQSLVSINVSRLQNENSFICRTWNEINSSNQVLVKLKLAENFLDRRRTPGETLTRIDDQLPRNPTPPVDTHFLFTKQFSILQMIGAVVGTFTSVIVLIFVICCTQEHLMKKTATSNPYWTIIPTEMKSPPNRIVTTKGPISPTMAMVNSTSNSQDYDIPQYQESNNFLQNYFTERNVPHYMDTKPTNYFSTVT